MAYRQRIVVGVTLFTQCKEIKFGKPWDCLVGIFRKNKVEKAPVLKIGLLVQLLVAREILSTVNTL